MTVTPRTAAPDESTVLMDSEAMVAPPVAEPSSTVASINVVAMAADDSVGTVETVVRSLIAADRNCDRSAERPKGLGVKVSDGRTKTVPIDGLNRQRVDPALSIHACGFDIGDFDLCWYLPFRRRQMSNERPGQHRSADLYHRPSLGPGSRQVDITPHD